MKIRINPRKCLNENQSHKIYRISPLWMVRSGNGCLLSGGVVMGTNNRFYTCNAAAAAGDAAGTVDD